MDEMEDRPRALKRRGKQKSQVEISTILLVLAAVVGVIFICIFINMMAGETETEMNLPVITQTPTITPALTQVSTVIPHITVQPTESPAVNVTVTVNQTQLPTESMYDPSIHNVLLNYTYNSNQYWMSVPVDDKLATTINTKKSPYVCTTYRGNVSCSFKDNETYYRNYIYETEQNNSLNTIINTIRTQTNNTDDQARIAISLVQNIPYDTNKATNLTGVKLRYPYMVIYDHTGICSEKSFLLASLLQRLEYGVVLFGFDAENHMTVGIKSPGQYSYKNTGYAFIESCIPSIPTNSNINYVNIGKLTTAPTIYNISSGNPMNSIGIEYNNNIEYTHLSSMNGTYLSEADYNYWMALNKKYGLVVK